MKLTKKEFIVLSEIACSKRRISRKALAAEAKCSIDEVDAIIKKFTGKGCLESGVITQSGLDALEPYRVKRAIFMAAGFGVRMVPITLNTPKPLVRVNGTRIIDTLIDACIKAEIEEIYIVRGYLREQFDQLLYKYPMIKFIENPAYSKTNNISSIMAARKLLKNAYVLEADLLVSNPKIIKKYQYTSNYLGIKMDKSDDWCFTVENGYINYQGIGAVNCFQEVGIAYLDKKAATQYEKDVKEFYNTPDGKNWFWDYILFGAYKEHYKFEIRECNREDVIEIDTFNELKELDKSYDV